MVAIGVAAIIAFKQRSDAQIARRSADEQGQLANEQRKAAERQRTTAVAAQQDAETQKKRASEIASQGNVSLARYSLDTGNTQQALAHLAQALRMNPQNRVAASFTAGLLLGMNSPLRLNEPMRHKSSVTFAQFSPDGLRLVTASADDTARLWDVVTGKPLGEPMQHANHVVVPQFSPDGKRVITVVEREDRDHDTRDTTYQSSLRVCDGKTGKAIGEAIHLDARVSSARISPDGNRVIIVPGVSYHERETDTNGVKLRAK